MLTPEKESELLERLKDGVLKYDEEIVAEAAYEALDAGMDAFKAVFEGLVSGMQEVGRLYEEHEYFVPEMLMCTDALYGGLHILRPHIKNSEGRVKAQVVMGVIKGDVHDIGKNIVKILFDAAGFEVHDLGRDVPLEDFLEEQLVTNSNLVCLSAAMTTTMAEMKDVIAKIKERNPKVKIMIGGAPVTEDIAENWGADGYAKDANNALQEAINMITSLKDIVKAS